MCIALHLPSLMRIAGDLRRIEDHPQWREGTRSMFSLITEHYLRLAIQFRLIEGIAGRNLAFERVTDELAETNE